MKQQVNPVVAAVIVVVVLGVAGFLVWRGTAGSIGGPGPGEKGNASPFAPGGAALGKGGAMPADAKVGHGPPAGNPNIPPH